MNCPVYTLTGGYDVKAQLMLPAGSDLCLSAKPGAVMLRQRSVSRSKKTHGGISMGSNVRRDTAFGRVGGKAAVIAGAAAALLCTGTATAATMTPSQAPGATANLYTLASRHNGSKPRTGSGRDPVQLGPGRSAVAGKIIPRRP
jgi:hypothetical protein